MVSGIINYVIRKKVEKYILSCYRYIMMKSRLLGLDDCSVPYHIGWLADPIMITPVINVAAVPSAQAPLKVMKARIKGSWLHI